MSLVYRRLQPSRAAVRNPGIAGRGRRAGLTEAIRSRTALVRYLGQRGDDPDEELENWEALSVPRAKRPLFLPSPMSSEWYDVVVSLAKASMSSESGGPMVRDRREEICRSGDVYFVLSDDDGEYSVSVVGVYPDPERGLLAAVRASDAFLAAPSGDILSLWSDEGDGFELYYPGDDDDDEDADVAADRPAVASWKRLTELSIIDESGVVLAGPGASSALPSSEEWLVVPSVDTVHRALLDLDPMAHRVTIRRTVGRSRTLKGTASDAIGSGVANRLAAGWGHSHWYHLTHDAIHEVDVAAEEIVGRALRVR